MSFGEVFIYLLDGFRYTCLIFFFTLIFALPLGLLMSFCTMSKFKPLSATMKVIVWIIRGIPLMLQIFMIYYLPGLLGTNNIFSNIDLYFLLRYDLQDMGRFIAVIIAFSINYAAYFSEIFRGGIESIPRGQYEAAQVLGMTKSQTFFRIILPQVIKRILPPMSFKSHTDIRTYNASGKTYGAGHNLAAVLHGRVLPAFRRRPHAHLPFCGKETRLLQGVICQYSKSKV